jgi:hypothetical protein
MPELLPNQNQARALVVSLGVFWLLWGVAVGGFAVAAPVGAIALVVALFFAFRFYFTLYRVWEPESGVSPWRMMFVPSLSRRRVRASLRLFDLFRPSWIRHTLRVTGWNPRLTGGVLLGLLIVDLLLALLVFPNVPSDGR